MSKAERLAEALELLDELYKSSLGAKMVADADTSKDFVDNTLRIVCQLEYLLR